MNFTDISFTEKQVSLPLEKLQSKLSRGCRRLVVTGYSTGSVKAYDLDTRELIADLNVGTKVQSLKILDAFSLVVPLDKYDIGLYSISAHKMLVKFQGHNGDILALEHAKNTLYSAGADLTIRAWNINTGDQKWMYQHTLRIMAIGIIAPERLLFGGDGQHHFHDSYFHLHLLDARNGSYLRVGGYHNDTIYKIIRTDKYVITACCSSAVISIRNNDGQFHITRNSFSIDEEQTYYFQQREISVIGDDAIVIGQNICRLSRNECIHTLPFEVFKCGYFGDPENLLFANADGEIFFYNYKTMEKSVLQEKVQPDVQCELVTMDTYCEK